MNLFLSKKNPRKSFLLRVLSVGVLVSYCLTSHFNPSVFADTSYKLAVPGTPKIFPLALEKFVVPEKKGQIQQKIETGSGKNLVILQDAHSLPEAQENIDALIRYLEKQYGISQTFVEGAASKLDPLFLSQYPDRQKLEKILKEFSSKGEIPGPVLSALLGDQTANYQGIEDWNLYLEGIEAFLAAKQEAAAHQKDLQSKRALLEIRKKTVYSQELQQMDQAFERYQNDPKLFMETLKSFSQFQMPEANSKIFALAKTLADENKELQHSKVQRFGRQVRELIKSSKILLSQEQEKSFFLKFQSFETHQISAAEFLGFLKTLPSVRIPSDLQESAEMAEKIQNLGSEEIAQQFEDYCRKVLESLLRTSEQAELFKELEHLRLLGKLAALQLSREEWEVLKRRMGERERGEYKNSLNFYQNAELREKVFLKKIENFFFHSSPSFFSQSAMLVIGGFHARVLAEDLKQKGISSVIISPVVHSIPEENFYEKHMAGNVLWAAYFSPRDGQISLYDSFNRFLRDRLLDRTLIGNADQTLTRSAIDLRSRAALDLTVFKLWRDQIIRRLADEKRLGDVGRYTKFLDEISPNHSAEPDWISKAREFMEGLRQLDASHQLTEQNILNLLKPAANISWAAGNDLLSIDSFIPETFRNNVKQWAKGEGEREREKKSDPLTSGPIAMPSRAEVRSNGNGKPLENEAKRDGAPHVYIPQVNFEKYGETEIYLRRIRGQLSPELIAYFGILTAIARNMANYLDGKTGKVFRSEHLRFFKNLSLESHAEDATDREATRRILRSLLIGLGPEGEFYHPLIKEFFINLEELLSLNSGDDIKVRKIITRGIKRLLNDSKIQFSNEKKKNLNSSKSLSELKTENARPSDSSASELLAEENFQQNRAEVRSSRRLFLAEALAGILGVSADLSLSQEISKPKTILPVSIYYGYHATRAQFEKAIPFFEKALKTEGDLAHTIYLFEQAYLEPTSQILTEKNLIQKDQAPQDSIKQLRQILRRYRRDQNFRKEMDFARDQKRRAQGSWGDRLITPSDLMEFAHHQVKENSPESDFAMAQAEFVQKTNIPYVVEEYGSFEGDVVLLIADLYYSRARKAFSDPEIQPFKALKLYREALRWEREGSLLRDKALANQIENLLSQKELETKKGEKISVPKETRRLLHYRGILHQQNSDQIAGKGRRIQGKQSISPILAYLDLKKFEGDFDSDPAVKKHIFLAYLVSTLIFVMEEPFDQKIIENTERYFSDAEKKGMLEQVLRNWLGEIQKKNNGNLDRAYSAFYESLQSRGLFEEVPQEALRNFRFQAARSEARSGERKEHQAKPFQFGLREVLYASAWFAGYFATLYYAKLWVFWVMPQPGNIFLQYVRVLMLGSSVYLFLHMFLGFYGMVFYGSIGGIFYKELLPQNHNDSNSSNTRSEARRRSQSLRRESRYAQSARAEVRAGESEQLLKVANHAFTQLDTLYDQIDLRLDPESPLRETLFSSGLGWRKQKVLSLHIKFLTLLRNIKNNLEPFLAGKSKLNDDIVWMQEIKELKRDLPEVFNRVHRMTEEQLSSGEREFLIGPQGKWRIVMNEFQRVEAAFYAFYWSPELKKIRLLRYFGAGYKIETGSHSTIIVSSETPFSYSNDFMYQLADDIGLDFWGFQSEKKLAEFHDQHGKLHALLSRSEARSSQLPPAQVSIKHELAELENLVTQIQANVSVLKTFMFPWMNGEFQPTPFYAKQKEVYFNRLLTDISWVLKTRDSVVLSDHLKNLVSSLNQMEADSLEKDKKKRTQFDTLHDFRDTLDKLSRQLSAWGDSFVDAHPEFEGIFRPMDSPDKSFAFISYSSWDIARTLFYPERLAARKIRKKSALKQKLADEIAANVLRFYYPEIPAQDLAFGIWRMLDLWLFINFKIHLPNFENSEEVLKWIRYPEDMSEKTGDPLPEKWDFGFVSRLNHFQPMAATRVNEKGERIVTRHSFSRLQMSDVAYNPQMVDDLARAVADYLDFLPLVTAKRSEVRMITRYSLKEEFGERFDDKMLQVDKNDPVIYDNEIKFAEKIPWAKYVFRRLTPSGQDPSRVLKVTFTPADNEALLHEARNLAKLEKASVQGVPRLVHLGMTQKGGLWLELDGIANARSMNSEIFGQATRLLDALLRAAEILKEAHQAGILHNDIKPSNILINEDQVVQINDWEQGVTTTFAPRDEMGRPLEPGIKRDIYSFILMLAGFFQHQMDASINPKLFRDMRDQYLKLIFESWDFDNTMDIFSFNGWETIVKRPISEWPETMDPVIDLLKEDLEYLISQKISPRSEVRSSEQVFEFSLNPKTFTEIVDDKNHLAWQEIRIPPSSRRTWGGFYTFIHFDGRFASDLRLLRVVSTEKLDQPALYALVFRRQQFLFVLDLSGGQIDSGTYGALKSKKDGAAYQVVRFFLKPSRLQFNPNQKNQILIAMPEKKKISTSIPISWYDVTAAIFVAMSSFSLMPLFWEQLQAGQIGRLKAMGLLFLIVTPVIAKFTWNLFVYGVRRSQAMKFIKKFDTFYLFENPAELTWENFDRLLEILMTLGFVEKPKRREGKRGELLFDFSLNSLGSQARYAIADFLRVLVENPRLDLIEKILFTLTRYDSDDLLPLLLTILPQLKQLNATQLNEDAKAELGTLILKAQRVIRNGNNKGRAEVRENYQAPLVSFEITSTWLKKYLLSNLKPWLEASRIPPTLIQKAFDFMASPKISLRIAVLRDGQSVPLMNLEKLGEWWYQIAQEAAARGDIILEKRAGYFALMLMNPKDPRIPNFYSQFRRIYFAARQAEYGNQVPEMTSIQIPIGERETAAADLILPKDAHAGKVPLVIFFHGLTNSKEQPSLDIFEESFIRAGIAVLRLDLPRHGQNGSRIRAKNRPEIFSEIVEKNLTYLFDFLTHDTDIPELDYAVDKKRLGVLGFSFGGYVGLRALMEHGNSIKALAVINAPVRSRFLYPEPFIVSGYEFLAHILDTRDREQMKKAVQSFTIFNGSFEALLSQIDSRIKIFMGTQDDMVKKDIPLFKRGILDPSVLRLYDMKHYPKTKEQASELMREITEHFVRQLSPVSESLRAEVRKLPEKEFKPIKFRDLLRRDAAEGSALGIKKILRESGTLAAMLIFFLDWSTKGYFLSTLGNPVVATQLPIFMSQEIIYAPLLLGAFFTGEHHLRLNFHVLPQIAYWLAYPLQLTFFFLLHYTAQSKMDSWRKTILGAFAGAAQANIFEVIFTGKATNWYAVSNLGDEIFFTNFADLVLIATFLPVIWIFSEKFLTMFWFKSKDHKKIQLKSFQEIKPPQREQKEKLERSEVRSDVAEQITHLNWIYDIPDDGRFSLQAFLEKAAGHRKIKVMDIATGDGKFLEGLLKLNLSGFVEELMGFDYRYFRRFDTLRPEHPLEEKLQDVFPPHFAAELSQTTKIDLFFLNAPAAGSKEIAEIADEIGVLAAEHALVLVRMYAEDRHDIGRVDRQMERQGFVRIQTLEQSFANYPASRYVHGRSQDKAVFIYRKHPDLERVLETTALYRQAVWQVWDDMWYGGDVTLEKKKRLQAEYNFLNSQFYPIHRMVFDPEKNIEDVKELIKTAFGVEAAQSGVDLSRSELRKAAAHFLARLQEKQVFSVDLQKAARLTAKMGSEPVVKALESLILEFVSNDLAGKKLGRDFDSMKRLLENLKQGLRSLRGGYTIGYEIPEKANADSIDDFIEAVSSLGFIKEVKVEKAEKNSTVFQRLAEGLKLKGIQVSTDHLNRQGLVFWGNQFLAGKVAYAAQTPAAKSRFISILLLEGESPASPFVSKTGVMIQTAIALLLAEEIKDEAARARYLTNPELLLNKYGFLQGFQGMILSKGDHFEISTEAVQKYLQWSAHEALGRSA